MFFALPKFLEFFLVPSNIMASVGLIGLALLAVGYSRAGRYMLVASIVLIVAVGVLPICNGLALPLENRFPRWDETRGPPTGIVVLGGGVIRPNISIDRGVATLGPSAERIIAAVELALRYPGARIVFSGREEGDFVIRIFEKLGVARNRIILEQKSRNTTENAVFTKQLAMPKASERWLLVTSAMHMPRAIGVFQKASFAIEAYPVDYRTAGTGDLWTISDALMGGIGKTDLAVHEWIGLFAYWIFGRISEPFPGPMSEIAIPVRKSAQ
jgi:uncharacterized SAM-binding protein YcdF (DUF218 family)